MILRISVPTVILLAALFATPFVAAEENIASESPSRSADVCDLSDVRILGVNNGDEVPEEYRSKLVSAGPNQRDLVKIALGALPPFVCKAVSKIAFYNLKRPDGAPAWVDSHYPDLINVVAYASSDSDDRSHVLYASERNLSGMAWIEVQEYLRNQHPELGEGARRKMAIESVLEVWPRIIRRIIHEAFHCASHLVDEVQSTTIKQDFDNMIRKLKGTAPINEWDSSALDEAKRISEKVKPSLGVSGEFEDINKRFARMNWSKEYDVSIDENTEAPEIPVGFMSHYGQKSALEDVAELSSWVTFAPYEDNVSLENMPHLIFTAEELSFYDNLSLGFKYTSACDSLKGYSGGGISPKVGALYVKLLFLLDLEFINKSDLDMCLGQSSGDEPRIKVRRSGSGEGFHLFVGEPLSHSKNFDQSIQYSRLKHRIDLTAEGPTKTSNEEEVIGKYGLHIEIPEDRFPRGMYVIESCNPSGSNPASFYISLPGDPDYMCTRLGLVLVVRANKDLVEGAISVQSVMTSWAARPMPMPSLLSMLNLPIPKNTSNSTVFTFVFRPR